MKQPGRWLVVIFLIVLGFRLFFAFQSMNYDYAAYFNVRQIEHISHTGLPVMNDELSYGGRTLMFMPVFHYILGGFDMFLPGIVVFKILPNLFAASLVFIIYLMAKKLTSNDQVSLFAAFVSGFIPAFVAQTVNSVSSYALAIPLIFLMIYFIMNMSEMRYVKYFALLIFIAPFASIGVLLLVIGLLFYLVLIRVEGLKQKRVELEVILFGTFFVTWIYFLIFKNAFLEHGISIIWQNAPEAVLSFHFMDISIPGALFSMGLIPVIGGIYIIYRYLFKETDKNIYLLIGFAVSTGLMLWAKLIEPWIGFAFLGIILTLLFCRAFKLLLNYVDKTKFAKHRNNVFLGIFLVVVVTSIIPTYLYTRAVMDDAPSKADMEAFEWLGKYAGEDDVVLATLDEGYLVNYIGKTNVADNNFMMVENPAQRYNAVKRMYVSQYKTEAVSLLTAYDVKYIVFSEKAKREYSIEGLKYVDEDCFELVYDEEVKIYESSCKVEEI
jgi:hypothetical protein